MPLARIIHEEWRFDEFVVETRTRCDESRICFYAVTNFEAVSSSDRRISTRYDTPLLEARQGLSQVGRKAEVYPL